MVDHAQISTTMVSKGGSTTPSPRRTALRKPPRTFGRDAAAEVDSERAMTVVLSAGGVVRGWSFQV